MRKKRVVSPTKHKLKSRPKSGNSFLDTPSHFLRSYPGLGAWLLFVFFVLLTGGILSLHGDRPPVTPDPTWIRLFGHREFLLFGFLGLIFAFRFLPGIPERSRKDVPRGWAYLWFAVFLGLCFFTRFYHPEESAPDFWSDHVTTTGDIRNLIDYRSWTLIFPNSSRPPFFSYFSAFFWLVFPKASGVWITRLSGTLIDLWIIWGLYRLGSTLSGRLLGLIMMSLWAVSMPGMIFAYIGYGLTSAVLACVWAMFFLCRLIQKPTFSHFIYWGAAMAFGDYVYVPYRPWTPVMITIVLIWILFGSKKRPKGKWIWLLAVGVWVSWAFLFFYKNSFVPQNPTVHFLVNPWFLGLTAVILLSAYVKSRAEIQENEVNRKVFAWATAVGMMTLLMSPMWLNLLYSAYTSTISVVFPNGKPLTLFGLLDLFWEHTVFCLRTLVGLGGQDFFNYPLLNHEFFGSFVMLAIVVGLASFLSRPTWFKSFVLLMVFVGMVPFILCFQQHTGRLFGVVVPFFMIGGWGLFHFWELFSRLMKNNLARKSVFISILAFWVWDAQKSFAIGREWMARKNPDALIGMQVYKDWENDRVIIVPCPPRFVDRPLYALCDRREAWVFNDPNPIYSRFGQEEKDIILLMYMGDKAMEKRVRRDFPKAQWKEILSHDGSPFMERVTIPFHDLGETPGRVLYVQRVPRENWRRRFYWTYYPYGIAMGLIGWDESSPDLQTEFPPEVKKHFICDYLTAQADGEITVPVDGEYEFSGSKPGDVISLAIDGRTVLHNGSVGCFNHDFGAPQGRIYLRSGVHQVNYKISFFAPPLHFADINVKPPHGAKEWILGQPVPAKVAGSSNEMK